MTVHDLSSPVHYISLNSFYVIYAAGTRLYDWVAADLASVNYARTPWIVVSLHAPWCVRAQQRSSSMAAWDHPRRVRGTIHRVLPRWTAATRILAPLARIAILC